MTGVLALLGSGEFTESVIPVDKFLLGQIKNPKVAILPTAAGEEDTWPKWIKDGERHYIKLGVHAKGFPVIDKASANNKEIEKEIRSFNFFVFSGGDPGYLLRVLKETMIWNTIQSLYENGNVLVGSSAGAMVMGKKVWSDIKNFDKTEELNPWTPGLGIVDFGIIPHFDYVLREFPIEKLRKARELIPGDVEVAGIDEDTAYIKINEKWIVKGKGKVNIPAKF